ncbi:2-C-methyl-D-erythritol 4-phosphate cytidylyltransferase [Peptoniphilus duerdenii ATCC BAA-1640]|uniref:2-C-methyl-D-erythritol 4-phosphate cytidylyltransferase n=1 Tax=Peptoniphilus duerdenii ATCC BAA-1640 TaxID=862517 RepID=E0NMU3_9FIRM|nr:2-C-methyl-D-erythritol 4-phosphate cytidylyltransferase [Peptoniphilus duerdenii]EFM24911.1 2-C-methyl-D-erythritol 4-phosphate cytidylyltransferase [Peptoniphilus duerdenii ATCC BAA-1640]
MYLDNYVTAIIAAAGMGTRMKRKLNKQFLTIDNTPVLEHTLRKFDKSKYVDYIIVVIKETDISYLGEVLSKLKLNKKFKIVYGGSTRPDSIFNALKNLPEETKIVLTHDGARPFIDTELIDLSIEKVNETGSLVVGVPVKDTIKVSKSNMNVDFTPVRSELFQIQTPQVFLKDIIVSAYNRLMEEDFTGTDDASFVEKNGGKVKILMGSYKNIKITTPEDLLIAEVLINSTDI